MYLYIYVYILKYIHISRVRGAGGYPRPPRMTMRQMAPLPWSSCSTKRVAVWKQVGFGHTLPHACVQGSGFRVQGLGLGVRVEGLGFSVQGLGFRVWGSGFRVQGVGFRVEGSRFRFQG